jgi:hypothetical protein
MNNNSFDRPTIFLQLGHRGRVAVFIDGNNLFRAFSTLTSITTNMRVLLGDGRLLRPSSTLVWTSAPRTKGVFCYGCGATVFVDSERTEDLL